jgi:putative transposase
MARAYSMDLRERVVAAVERGGESRHAAASRFGVAVSTAVKWMQRYRRTGSVAAGPMGGHKPKKIAGAHREWLIARCRTGDFTLRGLVAELAERGLKVDYRSVWAFAHAEGLSFKKRMARPVRKQFLRYESCQSASTYPACGHSPGQDGDPRVPVLIKLTASERHFLNQVARTPVGLSGHLASTTHRHRQLPARISAFSDLDQAAFTAAASYVPP